MCPLKSPKASPSRTPTQHPLPKAQDSDGASLRLPLGPGEPSSSQWDLQGYNLQLENRLCSLPAGKMQKKRDTAKTPSIRLWAEQKLVCSHNSVRAPGKRFSFEVPTGISYSTILEVEPNHITETEGKEERSHLFLTPFCMPGDLQNILALSILKVIVRGQDYYCHCQDEPSEQERKSFNMAKFTPFGSDRNKALTHSTMSRHFLNGTVKSWL